MFQTLFLLFLHYLTDPGLGDVPSAPGFASLRGEEEAGGAQQRGGAEQQSVGPAGVQQDSGQLLGTQSFHLLFLNSPRALVKN